MVKFDYYSGQTLTVPIVRRTLHVVVHVWAVTIHKAQGLTLNKVVID